MKTFKLHYSPALAARLVTLAIIVVSASAIRSAFAGGIGANLVLTENSSTSLSLSYNGPATAGAFSVINTGSDAWTIQVSNSFGPISLIDFNHDWAEPENPTQAFINEVSHAAANDTQSTMFLFVRSDLNIVQDSNGAGGVSPDNTSFLVGDDSGTAIFLTFHDLAQSAETQGPSNGVPDTGSTLGMLALASMALLGVSRVWRLRTA